MIAAAMSAFGILLLACCQWSLDRVHYVFTYCNGMDVVDIKSIVQEIRHARVQLHFKLSMMHRACNQTFCIQVSAPAISDIAASPRASECKKTICTPILLPKEDSFNWATTDGTATTWLVLGVGKAVSNQSFRIRFNTNFFVTLHGYMSDSATYCTRTLT